MYGMCVCKRYVDYVVCVRMFVCVCVCTLRYAMYVYYIRIVCMLRICVRMSVMCLGCVMCVII